MKNRYRDDSRDEELCDLQENIASYEENEKWYLNEIKLKDEKNLRLVEALKKADIRDKTIQMIRNNNFVFEELDAKSKDEMTRWQTLAFSLYTDLIHIGVDSEEALKDTTDHTEKG